MANKDKANEDTGNTDERKNKIEHNNEVHEKMKNKDAAGIIGDKFVDDHYVPRCY